jgi:hypothetical protein
MINDGIKYHVDEVIRGNLRIPNTEARQERE